MRAAFHVLDQDEALDSGRRRTYEELRAAGVEFTQEPTVRLYGTDCALRDPFGNPIRSTQPPDGPVVVPSADDLRAQA